MASRPCASTPQYAHLALPACCPRRCCRSSCQRAGIRQTRSWARRALPLAWSAPAPAARTLLGGPLLLSPLSLLRYFWSVTWVQQVRFPLPRKLLRRKDAGPGACSPAAESARDARDCTRIARATGRSVRFPAESDSPETRAQQIRHKDDRTQPAAAWWLLGTARAGICVGEPPE